MDNIISTASGPSTTTLLGDGPSTTGARGGHTFGGGGRATASGGTQHLLGSDPSKKNVDDTAFSAVNVGNGSKKRSTFYKQESQELKTETLDLRFLEVFFCGAILSF